MKGVVYKSFLLVASLLVVGVILTLPFCHKDDVLRLGLLINLSGPGGRAGRYIRDGVLFATEKMVSPYKYLVFIGDYDETDFKLKKRIDELYAKGVRIFIGPVTSHAALVALKHAESSKEKALFIVPYAATTKLSRRKDYLVRTCVDNGLFGKAFDRWLKQKGLKKVFVILDTVNPEFTFDILRSLRSLGIVADSFAFNSREDFESRLSAAVRAVFDSQPDVVLFLTRTRETVILSQKLRSSNFKGVLAATVWAQTPELIKWGGEAVEGLTIISFVRACYSNPEYIKLSEEFRRKAGYRLNARAVRALEAVEILSKVLREADSTDFRKVYQLLLNRRFSTIMGKVYIDEYGDAQRPVYETVVEKGRFVTKRVLLDEY